jgi:hypothetical protein
MNVNYEIERIWKDVVMANFKVVYQHLPGGTKEDHKKPKIITAGLQTEI